MFKSWNLVFYLLLLIGLSGGYVPPVWGQETTPPADSAPPATVTTITAIESEFSSGNLQLRLQTADNKPLAATQSERGSTLTIEIDNARLATDYRRTNPTNGIATITAQNIAPNRVRVEIVGIDALPSVTLGTGQQGLTIAKLARRLRRSNPRSKSSSPPKKDQLSRGMSPSASQFYQNGRSMMRGLIL